MKLTLPTLALSLLMSAPLLAQTGAAPKKPAKAPSSPTHIGNTHPTGSSLAYKRPSKATRPKVGSARVRDIQPSGSSLKYNGRPTKKSSGGAKKTAKRTTSR